MELSEKIKELRKERGLSQYELAQALQIARCNYSNWEQGRNEPNTTMLIRLANFFEVTLDELLGRQDYATGIVEVHGAQLTVDEQELLDLYRKMTFQNKNQLIGFAKGLLY